jgi:hypothetical protein
VPAFLVPVIVVGGIIGGIASPTESATFAVVYGFAASLVVYRAVGLRSAWVALRDAALTAGHRKLQPGPPRCLGWVEMSSPCLSMRRCPPRDVSWFG